MHLNVLTTCRKSDLDQSARIQAVWWSASSCVCETSHRIALQINWNADIVDKTTAVPESAKEFCRHSEINTKVTRQTLILGAAAR